MIDVSRRSRCEGNKGEGGSNWIDCCVVVNGVHEMMRNGNRQNASTSSFYSDRVSCRMWGEDETGVSSMFHCSTRREATLGEESTDHFLIDRSIGRGRETEQRTIDRFEIDICHQSIVEDRNRQSIHSREEHQDHDCTSRETGMNSHRSYSLSVVSWKRPWNDDD